MIYNTSSIIEIIGYTRFKWQIIVYTLTSPINISFTLTDIKINKVFFRLKK